MESLRVTAPCFARLSKAAAQYNGQQTAVPRFLLIGRVCEGRGDAQELIGIPTREMGSIDGDALVRLKAALLQLYPGMSVIGWASTCLEGDGDEGVWRELHHRLQLRVQYVFKMRMYTHEEMPTTESFLMSPGEKVTEATGEHGGEAPGEEEKESEAPPVVKPIPHQIVVSDSDSAVLSSFFSNNTNLGHGGVAYVAQKLVDTGDHAAAVELSQELTPELVSTLRERLASLREEVNAALAQQYPGFTGLPSNTSNAGGAAMATMAAAEGK